ncbi:MAG TPA: hypothetical protein VGV35_04315 [Bryobacteraceae bacterium]|nr:hypothetical protein [Bryobacteraceae bacterium]
MIILQFDKAYHHWGLLALQSLQLHEPHTPVLCNTVNLTEALIAELERAHGQVSITNGVSDRSTTPEQMAARKPFVLLHAIENYPDEPWYALLDADFLVRRPLNSLWALLDDHPAALFITDGFEHGTYYRQLVTPSGIVLVRREARKLIDCWAKWYHHDRALGSIEPLAWYWDQITLAEAWTEAGVPCATIPLDIYGDDQLRPSAAIWSANVGDRKQRYYELFGMEYQRQRSKALATESLHFPAVLS